LTSSARVPQYQKPAGWLGRLVLWNMNSHHSKVTDWGLSQISVGARDTVLDVGCGGGRTVSKLAAMAIQGKVYGLDYSKASVDFARKTNKQWIKAGRVEIHEGSVSKLPFSENMFDLVTAVETHYWWPDLPHDMRQVFRVLNPGGTLVIIAEVYKDATTSMARLIEQYPELSGVKLMTVEEHRELVESAGFSAVQFHVDSAKGWICAVGRKPAS
jgi:ubiquinone/menaquinone biosynthesis C-methylase UbiE